MQSSSDEMQQVLATTTQIPNPYQTQPFQQQIYPQIYTPDHPPGTTIYPQQYTPQYYPQPTIIDRNLYEMQQKYTKLQQNFNKLQSDFSHQQHLHQIPFHWSHGGNEVYVAYSGDNWSQKYQMYRNTNGFSLIMEIPAGIYHYKYIVDNEWQCAPDQPHVKDSTGAYSNLLQIPPKTQETIVVEVHEIEEEPKVDGYTQSIPDERNVLKNVSLNNKMKHCPPHLLHVILNQKKRRKSKNNDICYHSQMVDKPMRVSLNHLYVSENREEEIVTLGVTERYRDKYYTTVYYKPIDRTFGGENRA